MLDNDVLLIEATDVEIAVDRHELLPEPSAAVLAHLICAGAQGGMVSGVSRDQVNEAISDARKAAGSLYGSNWLLAVVRFDAEVRDLEPGSSEMCFLAAEMYERGHTEPGLDAPAKKGRPTLASGRWGRVGDRSRQHRTAGTKLSRNAAARRNQE